VVDVDICNRGWDVIKNDNKDNTVLLKDDIAENMVINKNPTGTLNTTVPYHTLRYVSSAVNQH